MHLTVDDDNCPEWIVAWGDNPTKHKQRAVQNWNSKGIVQSPITCEGCVSRIRNCYVDPSKRRVAEPLRLNNNRKDRKR